VHLIVLHFCKDITSTAYYHVSVTWKELEYVGQIV